MRFRPNFGQTRKHRETTPPAPITTPKSKATEVIRTAEKLIEEKRFDLAAEKLSAAQKLDPNNQYILAIIDRITHLRTHAEQEQSNADSSRYLSVTVGSEFKDGIRPEGETERLVTRLTATAEEFLKKGSLDSALESLMNAYFLDPESPSVIACEKHVIPAWERAHRRGETSFDRRDPLSSEEMFDSLSNLQDRDQTKNIPDALLGKLNQDARLELLKQQKEAERLRREQEIYREASRPRNS